MIVEGDIVIREFFLGFVNIHILYHASVGAICGVDLSEELARHGYDLGPGTLYPTLHRLQEQGHLTRETRVVKGRARKYYTITDKGHGALSEARRKIAELVGEVLDGR